MTTRQSFPTLTLGRKIMIVIVLKEVKVFPSGSMVKNLPTNAGDERDRGLVPGSGRSPGEGNGNPLQYSCLENSMDRGA